MLLFCSVAPQYPKPAGRGIHALAKAVEQSRFRGVRQRLFDDPAGDLFSGVIGENTTNGIGEQPFELLAGAVALLMDILEAMATGRGVMIIPETAELTTLQAAERVSLFESAVRHPGWVLRGSGIVA